MTTTVGHFIGQNFGPKCRHCRQSEARCAWVGGCCNACGHWPKLDAHGNEKTKGRPGRPATSCEPCRFRRVACEHRLAS